MPHAAVTAVDSTAKIFSLFLQAFMVCLSSVSNGLGLFSEHFKIFGKKVRQ